jgi:hypothetical protein
VLLIAVYKREPEQADKSMQELSPHQASSISAGRRAHFPGIHRQPVGVRREDQDLFEDLYNQVRLDDDSIYSHLFLNC